MSEEEHITVIRVDPALAAGLCGVCGEPVAGTFTHPVTVAEYWTTSIGECCQDGMIGCVGLDEIEN